MTSATTPTNPAVVAVTVEPEAAVDFDLDIMLLEPVVFLLTGLVERGALVILAAEAGTVILAALLGCNSWLSGYDWLVACPDGTARELGPSAGVFFGLVCDPKSRGITSGKAEGDGG